MTIMPEKSKSTSVPQGCCGTKPERGAERGTEDMSVHEGIHQGRAGGTALKGRTEDRAALVPQVSSQWTWKDRLGHFMARWGVRRMDFKVKPGLYRVGNPTEASEVFVSANYKMSFDHLRSALAGLDGWILVLNTRGINVWCAAGKGTFGTKELAARIRVTKLADLVIHRRLILPQLGAPGVAAHEITRSSGFKVIYGPVEARHIKPFLEDGLKAAPWMRKKQFPLKDRLVLTPVELVQTLKYLGIVFPILALLHYMQSGIAGTGAFLTEATLFLATVVLGTVLGPVLLPWLPGRSFAVKGWLLGLLWSFALFGSTAGNLLLWCAYLLFFPATTAFLLLNFTGASTYTSLSGVVKEMRWSIPVIIVLALLGAGFRITTVFV